MSEVTGNDPAAFCEIVELGRIRGNDVEKDLVDYGIELTLAGKLSSIESCNNRGCLVHGSEGVGSSSSSTPLFMSGLGSVHRPHRKILWKYEAQHIVFATGFLVVDFATSRRTAPLSLRSSWPLRARHHLNVPSPSANRPSLETGTSHNMSAGDLVLAIDASISPAHSNSSNSSSSSKTPRWGTSSDFGFSGALVEEAAAVWSGLEVVSGADDMTATS